MPVHLFFYLGFSLLLIHEMDAVHCREWKIFPGLSKLKESIAYPIFLIAHVPLFLILLLALQSSYKSYVIVGLNLFLILHLGLHILFLKHQNNLFKDLYSWILIISMALCGALDLVLHSVY